VISEPPQDLPASMLIMVIIAVVLKKLAVSVVTCDHPQPLVKGFRVDLPSYVLASVA
jgi:hypothetical protein